jgi:hypothetical protein
MKIPRDKVVPARYHLVGFSGEKVLAMGSIKLSVIAGTYSRQHIIMVKFLFVDRPSAYSAIFGRTALNELKAITSTPHLSMKVSTNEGVGIQPELLSFMDAFSGYN